MTPPQILKVVGQVAGIGGIALGVLLILFRDVIRKSIFPKLTKKQGFHLLVLISVLVWSIALAGIVAWVKVRIPSQPSPQTSTPTPIQTNLFIDNVCPIQTGPKNNDKLKLAFDISTRKQGEEPINVTNIAFYFDEHSSGNSHPIKMVKSDIFTVQGYRPVTAEYVVTLTSNRSTIRTPDNKEYEATYKYEGTNLIVEAPLFQKLVEEETDRFQVSLIFDESFGDLKEPFKTFRVIMDYNEGIQASSTTYSFSIN